MTDQAAVPAVAGNDAVLQNLAAQLNTPLPSPYTTGAQQQAPTVPAVKQFQPQSTNNQPMNNQATSIKNARQKNNFAAIGNFIGQAANMYQEKKNTALKNDITSVMRSKQNVENAQKVLSTPGIDDATKKQAQAVLDANNKNVDSIFSDSKNRKGLEKAFDISYVDMEKNKTPEVAQALAAKKEVDGAGNLNYNNPGELKVAQAAGATQAPAAAQTQAQPQAATPAPKSQTPYADAALAKDMPTMEMNPQYQAALAQKAVAQKQYMAALPSIIKADSASTLANAKAGNAQALAVFKDSNALTKQAMEDADKLKTVNNEIAGRAKVQAMRDSTERADTTARIASQEKIATNRNLTAENIAGIKQNITKDIQTEVNKATTQKNTSHADMLTATNLPKGPERDSAMAIAKANEDSAQRNIDYWQKMMDAKTGTPPPSKPEAKVDEPSGPTLWSTYKVGQGSTLTNARAKELGFGDTNAGASSTNQSVTPSAQRTDPTDAEKAAAIKYATEVGPEDDNPHGDEDTDPDKY